MEYNTPQTRRKTTPPAFTVLEENIFSSSDDDNQGWLSAYENSTIIGRNDNREKNVYGSYPSPYPDNPNNVTYPSTNDYQWAGINDGNYPRPIPRSKYTDGSDFMNADQNPFSESFATPKVSQSFYDGLDNNYDVLERQSELGLQTDPGYPTPQNIQMPYFVPPYGTPYPSTNYSAYDSNNAMRAGTPMGYSIPGVPYGTPPALHNGRSQNSTPLGPQMRDQFIAAGYPANMLSWGNYPYPGLQTFPMPYNSLDTMNTKEGYSSCPSNLMHVIGCSHCKSVLTGNQNLLFVFIGFLLLVIVLLIILLFRNQKK